MKAGSGALAASANNYRRIENIPPLPRTNLRVGLRFLGQNKRSDEEPKAAEMV